MLMRIKVIGCLLACAGSAVARGASGDAGPSGDVAQGRSTFESICAVCHGAKGEGGAGLPLKNIADRMTLEQTIEKIKNPKDPMPKLYPAALTEQTMKGVAEFVRTLR
jgi:mono/diheme cytochrome c family protein